MASLETKLKRKELLEWFGGKEQYEIFHRANHNEKEIEEIVIEFQ